MRTVLWYCLIVLLSGVLTFHEVSAYSVDINVGYNNTDEVEPPTSTLGSKVTITCYEVGDTSNVVYAHTNFTWKKDGNVFQCSKERIETGTCNIIDLPSKTKHKISQLELVLRESDIGKYSCHLTANGKAFQRYVILPPITLTKSNEGHQALLLQILLPLFIALVLLIALCMFVSSKLLAHKDRATKVEDEQGPVVKGFAKIPSQESEVHASQIEILASQIGSQASQNESQESQNKIQDSQNEVQESQHEVKESQHKVQESQNKIQESQHEVQESQSEVYEK